MVTQERGLSLVHSVATSACFVYLMWRSCMIVLKTKVCTKMHSWHTYKLHFVYQTPYLLKWLTRHNKVLSKRVGQSTNNARRMPSAAKIVSAVVSAPCWCPFVYMHTAKNSKQKETKILGCSYKISTCHWLLNVIHIMSCMYAASKNIKIQVTVKKFILNKKGM